MNMYYALIKIQSIRYSVILAALPLDTVTEREVLKVAETAKADQW